MTFINRGRYTAPLYVPLPYSFTSWRQPNLPVGPLLSSSSPSLRSVLPYAHECSSQTRSLSIVMTVPCIAHTPSDNLACPSVQCRRRIPVSVCLLFILLLELLSVLSKLLLAAWSQMELRGVWPYGSTQ